MYKLPEPMVTQSINYIRPMDTQYIIYNGTDGYTNYKLYLANCYTIYILPSKSHGLRSHPPPTGTCKALPGK